jgi:hypothetical protein
MSRLSAREKVRRDDAIVADRARGLTWATVAERHGVSDRHAREVWREYAKHRNIVSADPEDAVLEALDRYDAIIEELVDATDNASNESVRLGALKHRLAATRAKVDLQASTGMLANHDWTEELRSVRKILTAIFQVLDEHGIPDDVQLAAIEAAGNPIAYLNGRQAGR